MVHAKKYFFLFCLVVLPLEIHASDVDIFAACEQGNLEVVKELVQADPEAVSSTDQQGYTPLHEAAYNGHLQVAEYLVSQAADINAASASGSTPLHGAAFHGHPEVARFLIEKGAEIDIANAGGYTPILSASAAGRSELVRILTEAGADINASPNGVRSALHQAVWNADTELTKFLLDNGAKADIQTARGVSLPYFAVVFRDQDIGEMFIDRITDVAETDEQGLGLLHYAATRGFAELARTLLDQGVEVDSRDSLGRTPLYYASLWKHDELVDILKTHGGIADGLDQPWFEADYLGRSVPGKTPVEFVGDELRTPFAPHGKLAISPDGKEMLWCHQAMPIQAMWYARNSGLRWQPTIAPFTDPSLDYADGGPCFSADGSQIYYHSHRPHPGESERTTDTDIWYVDKTTDGWSEPVLLEGPVNTDKYELAPTIAPSGNLYFIGSEYEDTHGAGDIYVSELLGGAYTAPRNLGASINSPFHELSPVVSSDESYLIFASNRLHMFRRDVKLYVSFRGDDGWTQPVSLGRTINRGHTWHPFITADDKYVFYQQGAGYHWFSSSLINDIKVAVTGSGQAQPAVRIPVLRKSEQVFEHAATNHIALGDLDSDGDLDAIFSNMRENNSRVYLNDGRGQFAVTQQLLTQQGHGVDLGDLDADGDLDIFMTCAGYGSPAGERSLPSKVYFNDGRANFTASSQNLGDSLSSGNAAQLHDIDSDGDLDAAVVYYQEDNGIFLNDGQGQFTRSDLTFPTSANWADLDGDGDVDIFHREANVGFRTLLNDGTGHFVEHWTKIDSGVHRGGVCLGDIDEDGDIDAVVAHLDQSEHRYSALWYNDGTGRFTESDIRLPLTRYARLSTGDLNDDGHLDVFLNNFGLPSAVWLNDGKGGLFDSGIRLPGVWHNTDCPLGDLDGDGDLDIFIAAFGGGPNEVWFNQE